MSKRKYIKEDLLAEEIQEMRASGKTVREIAEHFSLEKSKSKTGLIDITESGKNLLPGLYPDRKAALARMLHQETLLQSRRMRSID